VAPSNFPPIFVSFPAHSRIYVHTTSPSPLPPSTELSVSYLDPFEPTSVRQSELLTRYGFVCDCPRCSNALVSDPRSEEIRRLKEEVGGWVSGEVSGEEAKRMMERVLELMDLEGVEAGRGQTAMDLSKIGAGHQELVASSLRLELAPVAAKTISEVWGKGYPQRFVFRRVLTDSRLFSFQRGLCSSMGQTVPGMARSGGRSRLGGGPPDGSSRDRARRELGRGNGLGSKRGAQAAVSMKFHEGTLPPPIPHSGRDSIS
jgi:hypothetical protein